MPSRACEQQSNASMSYGKVANETSLFFKTGVISDCVHSKK